MIIPAMFLCGIGVGLLAIAILERDREPVMPKAGTLLVGPGSFYVEHLCDWAGVSICGDAVLMVSKDQSLADGEALSAWIRCEIVLDRPVLEGGRPHKSGTKVLLRVSELDQWRRISTSETLTLMQQLHQSRQEVS